MFTPFLPSNFSAFSCSADIVSSGIIDQASVVLAKGSVLAIQLAQVCTQLPMTLPGI